MRRFPLFGRRSGNSSSASSASLTKALCDAVQIARVLAELDWLSDALELETALDNDQSPQPARLQGMITELCDFLNSLANQEIGEILEAEAGGLPLTSAMPGLLGISAGASDLERIAALLRRGGPNMRRLAAGIMAKAKHSQADQVLLDMAHFACDQCLKMGRLSVDEQADMDRARHHLQEAGAMPTPLWTTEGAEDNCGLRVRHDHETRWHSDGRVAVAFPRLHRPGHSLHRVQLYRARCEWPVGLRRFQRRW